MKKISKKEIRLAVAEAIAQVLAKYGIAEYNKKLDKLVLNFTKEVSVVVKKSHKKTTVAGSAKPAAKAAKKARTAKKTTSQKS